LSSPLSSGLVVDQARKGGFTFRTRDELSAKRAATAGCFISDQLALKGRSSSEEKASSDEMIAVA